jgi:hypothetical protein
VAAQNPETAKLAEDVRALKAGLSGLQANLDRVRPADDMKPLKAGLEAVKSDTAAAVSQLAGKLERGDQSVTLKLARLSERVDHLEHKPDPMPVGSITAPPPAPARAASVQPLPKPRKSARTDAPSPRAPIPGWILRDVYDGVALVEGRDGYSREVIVGEVIPGAGRIEAIERRGRRWVVVTNQGFIGPDL